MSDNSGFVLKMQGKHFNSLKVDRIEKDDHPKIDSLVEYICTPRANQFDSTLFVKITIQRPQFFSE